MGSGNTTLENLKRHGFLVNDRIFCCIATIPLSRGMHSKGDQLVKQRSLRAERLQRLKSGRVDAFVAPVGGEFTLDAAALNAVLFSQVGTVADR